MGRRGIFKICILLVLSLSPTVGWASGLILYEVNAPVTGTASAGWAAIAHDASTAFTNPAGMTRLDRSQLLVGAQPLIITSEFNSSTNGREGNADGVLPSLGGYYVHSYSDRLKMGVSLLSYFGLGIDYGDDWVGRYRVEKSTFLTTTLSPSIAYKVNDWLSVGAMINIVGAYFSSQTAINNILGQYGDGQLKFKNWDIGFGGGVGVMIEPTKCTRLGVVYYSPVNLSFKDTPSFDGLGPGLRTILGGLGLLNSSLSLDFTIPQWLMLSGYQQITDEFALMANFGWQNWSAFGNTDISLQVGPPQRINLSRSVTANLHMKDTYHYAIGGQYRISKSWLLSAGFAYDTSPMSEEFRSPSLPLDRTFRYACGIQYDWNKDVTLGFAYTFIDTGSAAIDKTGGPMQGNLQGSYDPNNVQAVNLNLIYRF